MRSKITSLVAAAGIAAMMAVSASAPAQAGGKEAGAFLGGLLLGGALAQRPYVAVPPGPGYYVAPPPRRCWWERYQTIDPYSGYPVWRSRKVCG